MHALPQLDDLKATCPWRPEWRSCHGADRSSWTAANLTRVCCQTGGEPGTWHTFKLQTYLANGEAATAGGDVWNVPLTGPGLAAAARQRPLRTRVLDNGDGTYTVAFMPLFDGGWLKGGGKGGGQAGAGQAGHAWAQLCCAGGARQPSSRDAALRATPASHKAAAAAAAPALSARPPAAPLHPTCPPRSPCCTAGQYSVAAWLFYSRCTGYQDAPGNAPLEHVTIVSQQDWCFIGALAALPAITVADTAASKAASDVTSRAPALLPIDTPDPRILRVQQHVFALPGRATYRRPLSAAQAAVWRTSRDTSRFVLFGDSTTLLGVVRHILAVKNKVKRPALLPFPHCWNLSGGDPVHFTTATKTRMSFSFVEEPLAPVLTPGALTARGWVVPVCPLRLCVRRPTMPLQHSCVLSCLEVLAPGGRRAGLASCPNATPRVPLPWAARPPQARRLACTTCGGTAATWTRIRRWLQKHCAT